MNAGFIVAYVLLFLLVVGGGIYIYSYYVYSKNTIFNAPKHNIITLVAYVILFVFLLVAGICYLTVLKKKELPLYNVHAILSFVLCFIYLIYFVLNILIVKGCSKGKIDYKNYQQINFKEMLTKTVDEIGDVESLKAYVAKHFKRYYKNMMSKYEQLLLKAKDETIPASAKVADIVLFDDSFTNKWSNKANKFHKFLVIQFMALI